MSNEGRRKTFGLTHGQIAFVCECSRPSCYDTVLLTRDAFDEIRGARGFVLAAGHAVSVPAG